MPTTPNPLPRILLVEDDETLGFLLQTFLSTRDMEVDWSKNGVEALQMFKLAQYDLCVLDVMMPALDGFTVAELLRQKQPGIPIIFLTAKSLHADVQRGFQAGADDYIKKPVEEEELVARIQAVLKRVGGAGTPTNKGNLTIFQIGAYVFDSQNGLLVFGTETKELTELEARLLKILCEGNGQLVDREMVLQKLWNRNDFLARKSMDVFISRLRKYLAKDERVQIVNVHGSGFVLEVK